MPYQIRKAHLNDADKIKDCITDSFEKYVPLIHKEPEPMTLDYSDVIKERSVFILEEGPEVVGVIVLAEGDSSFMWLDILGVYNKYHNKGFGKRLIEFGETVMRERGVTESRLYTNARFIRTIDIYRHLGYEIYDKKMQNGYDRVFLKKAL